jgi:PKD repeat protein
MVTTSTPTATFTPTQIGNLGSNVFVALPGSSTYHELVNLGSGLVQVVTPQPLVAAETFSSNGPLTVDANDLGTTDAWNITSAMYDFGDGTPTATVAGGANAEHVYAKAGTYTITEKLTDADGNTATTSSTYTTADPPAGTLLNAAGFTSGGLPVGSTGIAQVANTGTTTGSTQLLAATTSGQAELALGANAAWQAWQPLSQPGVTVKWVGIAGTASGSSQLIEVTSTGTLLHTIRNADGTFQPGGWGSPAGSAGFVRASIAAMPDGSAQLVAVTTAGVLMHDIRNANGSWQGWRALTQSGVKVVDASITGLPDGSAQIIEVTSAGVMKHDVRFANGSWQSSGWGSPAGSTGIVQASISTLSDGSTQIATVMHNGQAEINYRFTNGAWSGFVTLGIAPALSITDIASGLVPGGSPQLIAVSGG